MSSERSTGVADTSVWIAIESGRPLNIAALPDLMAVSIITIGELRVGVLNAPDVASRDARLGTLLLAQKKEPFLIDDEVTTAWARLRLALKAAGQRMEVNDSWIAATAMAHNMPVVTQDAGFPDLKELAVIHV